LRAAGREADRFERGDEGPDTGRLDLSEARVDPDAARDLRVGGGPSLGATAEVAAQDAPTRRALDRTRQVDEMDARRMLAVDASRAQSGDPRTDLDASFGVAGTPGPDTALGAAPAAGRAADFENGRIVEGGGALTEPDSAQTLDLVEEAVAEHADIRGMLADLRELPSGSPHFEARYVDLRDSVLLHLTTEEAQLFPRARRLLGERRLWLVGEAMRARKEALLPAARQVSRRRA
jgi:hypothetical protein